MPKHTRQVGADHAGYLKEMSEQVEIIWRRFDGTPIGCSEKRKVLSQNIAELRQVAKDAFEDALLMECDEAQVRQVFVELVTELTNPFKR